MGPSLGMSDYGGPLKAAKTGRPRGGRGYLLSDDAAAGGARIEMATMTCGHCGVVVVLNAERKRARGHCHRCNQYVCDRPGCKAECNPVEQGIELALAHPGRGPFLLRAPDGSILFDPTLRDDRRVF